MDGQTQAPEESHNEANGESQSPGRNVVKITENRGEHAGDFLRNAVLMFLASLHSLHRERYNELMDARANGTTLPPAGDCEESVAPSPVPELFQDIRALQSGPARGTGLIDGLNAGRSAYYADMDEAGNHTLANTLDTQAHLFEAINGSLALRDEATGKLHALTSFDQTGFILGLQTLDTLCSGLSMHGSAAISLLVDAGIYAIHNAEALRRSGTGVAVAVRDIRNEAEAEWVANSFRSIEDKTGLGPGNLRVFLVVDSISTVEALAPILARFGKRVCGIIFDSIGVSLSNVGNSPLNEAAQISGAVYSAAASAVSAAHALNVPLVWSGSGKETFSFVFGELRVDGVLCSTREHLDAAIEAAEDIFTGPNQIQEKPISKPSGGLALDTRSLSDVLNAFTDSSIGFTRVHDLDAALLIEGTTHDEVLALRSALRKFRSETHDGELASNLSSAFRILLKDQTAGGGRLSRVLQTVQNNS